MSLLQMCDENTTELCKACLEPHTVQLQTNSSESSALRALTAPAPLPRRRGTYERSGKDKGWNFMLMPSRVHLVSGTHTRLFRLMPSDVGGLNSLSLELSLVGQIGRSRHAALKTRLAHVNCASELPGLVAGRSWPWPLLQ